MKTSTIVKIGMILLIPMWSSCVPDKLLTDSSMETSQMTHENAQAIEVLNALFPHGDWEHEIEEDILYSSWFQTDISQSDASHLAVLARIIDVQSGVLYQISHHYNQDKILMASSGEDFEIKWMWHFNNLSQVIIYNLKTGEEHVISRSETF